MGKKWQLMSLLRKLYWKDIKNIEQKLMQGQEPSKHLNCLDSNCYKPIIMPQQKSRKGLIPSKRLDKTWKKPGLPEGCNWINVWNFNCSIEIVNKLSLG